MGAGGGIDGGARAVDLQCGAMTLDARPDGAQLLPAPLVARTVAVDPRDLPADLLDLLPAREGHAWVRRGDGLVAWGVAAELSTAGADRFADADAAWAEVTAHAVVRDEVRLPGTGPVAFGSFAFADDSPAGGTLVVPRVVVGRRGDDTWLTTIDVGAVSAPVTPRATEPPEPPGAVEYRTGGLDPAGWRAGVVARGRPDPRGASGQGRPRARRRRDRTEHPSIHAGCSPAGGRLPSCWTFSVDGMVGATPELLVRSEKGLVTSRVLAGTIRRTGDDDADLAHAAILAHSSKDLEEHEYAVASLTRALEPFCSSTNVPETPFVLHLPNVLHLASDVTGVLSGEGPSSLALAAALHPTAAVGGTPTAAGHARCSPSSSGWTAAATPARSAGSVRTATASGASGCARPSWTRPTRTACGCSPGAASSPRRSRRRSSPSPRPSSSRCATRSARTELRSTV